MSAAATVRVRRRNAFSVVPDEIFLDSRLSIGTRAVLAYLVGRPDGWEIHVIQIQKVLAITELVWRRARREMTAAGYFQQTRLRGAAGKWVWENVVWDQSTIPRKPMDGESIHGQPQDITRGFEQKDIYACTEPPKAVREMHAKKTVAQKVTPTQTKKPAGRKGAPRLPPVGDDGKFKYPYSEHGIECWTPGDLQKTKNLIFEFGEQAVSETAKKIAGDGRKPFPSAIFKRLKGKGKENENCGNDYIGNCGKGGIGIDDPFDAAVQRSRDRWAARAPGG